MRTLGLITGFVLVGATGAWATSQIVGAKSTRESRPKHRAAIDRKALRSRLAKGLHDATIALALPPSKPKPVATSELPLEGFAGEEQYGYGGEEQVADYADKLATLKPDLPPGGANTETLAGTAPPEPFVPGGCGLISRPRFEPAISVQIKAQMGGVGAWYVLGLREAANPYSGLSIDFPKDRNSATVDSTVTLTSPSACYTFQARSDVGESSPITRCPPFAATIDLGRVEIYPFRGGNSNGAVPAVVDSMDVAKLSRPSPYPLDEPAYGGHFVEEIPASPPGRLPMRRYRDFSRTKQLIENDPQELSRVTTSPDGGADINPPESASEDYKWIGR